MPLNVRRFFASAALLLFGFIIFIRAQSAPNVSPTPTTAPTAAPTAPIIKAAAPSAAEIMRERISKAKAFVAVKNYNAAIYELENIRRETGDQTVHSVINVLLMNSYLEQSDYRRAQEFLKELYNPQKSTKPVSSPYYFAVAGQVVKGARNQLERYRALGLTISDRNLPLEATVDVEKMRETLELVIEQSKTLGNDKNKTANAMALLEEATNSRGALARDDFDARRWKEEVGDAREQLANSRSVIFNAVTNEAAAPTTGAPQTPISSDTIASNTTEAKSIFKPISTENAAEKASEADSISDKKTEPPRASQTATLVIKKDGPAVENQASENKSANAATTETAAPENPATMQVGSLLEYATKQAKPVYPSAARSMRQTGVVRVEVVVNETGEVSQVENTSGPSALQSAAKDAIKKWRFKPFVRDGQPVKAKGYVSFNFAL